MSHHRESSSVRVSVDRVTLTDLVSGEIKGKRGKVVRPGQGEDHRWKNETNVHYFREHLYVHTYRGGIQVSRPSIS